MPSNDDFTEKGDLKYVVKKEQKERYANTN